MTRVIAVTPGSTQGFRMCGLATGDSQVANRTMVVQTVALAGD